MNRAAPTRNASPDRGGKVKKVVCIYCGKEFIQAKRKKVPVCFESVCQQQRELDMVKRSSSRDVKRRRRIKNVPIATPRP